MNHFKRLLLILLCFLFFNNTGNAQTKEEVVKKYIQATGNLKKYHMVYDTNSIQIDGVYATILKVPVVATIHIKDTAF